MRIQVRERKLVEFHNSQYLVFHSTQFIKMRPKVCEYTEIFLSLNDTRVAGLDFCEEISKISTRRANDKSRINSRLTEKKLLI